MSTNNQLLFDKIAEVIRENYTRSHNSNIPNINDAFIFLSMAMQEDKNLPSIVCHVEGEVNSIAWMMHEVFNNSRWGLFKVLFGALIAHLRSIQPLPETSDQLHQLELKIVEIITLSEENNYTDAHK